MTDLLRDSFASLLARRVEWHAGLYRSAGFKFPEKYEFGLSTEASDTGSDVTFRVRVDDTRISFILPGLYSFTTVELNRELYKHIGILMIRYATENAHLLTVGVNEFAENVASFRADDEKLWQPIEDAFKKAKFSE